MTGRSLRVALFAVAALVAFAPGRALADPAGPTDYRTEVESIEPESPTIDVEILGGDAFVQLTVDPGTDVVVMGYGGEPYLWFRPDGAVLENQNSAATLMNTSRNGAMPAGAHETDPTAEPEWKQIGSDHRWAWHDHRAHWMQADRPIGASPGDQILENEIPMEVDGSPVVVTVASRWEPAPSALPMWIGGVLGGLFAVGALRVSAPSVADDTMAGPAGGARARRRTLAVPVPAGGDGTAHGVVAAPGHRRHLCDRWDARRVRAFPILGRRGDARRRDRTGRVGLDQARRVVGGSDPDGCTRLARPSCGRVRIRVRRRVHRACVVVPVRCWNAANDGSRVRRVGQRVQGGEGLAAPGPPVRTSYPSSVTRMVCSYWAVRLPSAVTAVQSSSQIL